MQMFKMTFKTSQLRRQRSSDSALRHFCSRTHTLTSLINL